MPTLILPPALRYPVVVRDRNGKAVLSGLYDAQGEWWSWTAQGGSDSAAVQVAGRDGAALRHVLDWLDHEVLILAPGSGQAVWSGYVNRVSVPMGDFTLTRSLEGYANDLRVQYSQRLYGSDVQFVESAANSQAAWQQARFGVRSVLVQSDDTLVALDQEQVDELLAEYQNALGTVKTGEGLPSGARLECRGHAGRLDSRYFPTRDAGQYGDITRRAANSWVDIQYHANNAAGFDELYQYADLNPSAGHGPFAPAWPQYLRSVRIWNARSKGGSNAVFGFSVYELAAGNRPGGEVTAGAGGILSFGGGSDVPATPKSGPLDIDWVGDVGPTTELPAAGWYFGLKMGGAMVNGYLFEFNQVTDPQFWDAGNIGRTLLLRRRYGGTNVVWQSAGDGLSIDWFTGVTAAGLAVWLASGGAGGAAGFGAHPANAAADYRGTVSMYFEGDSTWRSALEEVAYADRLCYAIDGDRLLRFWQADGPDAEPLIWDGRGGANLGVFMGRRVRAEGEEFLLTGASYDPMSGRVDVSVPGKPSETVAGTRLGRL